MIALDFETYYDSEYSLKKMGAWAYCFHEKFDCYQVAVVTDKGVVYNGHPAGFNWESLRGELLLAHNASFDGLVFKRLQQDGVIPKDLGNEWVCTADLSVYFQGPRDLKGAAFALLGMTISKAYREKAKGRTGAQIVASVDSSEISLAGADDAVVCYGLAEKYLPLWPAEERELSRLNRHACWRGVQFDREGVKAAMDRIDAERFSMLRHMVWATDAEDTPLSMIKIREHGRKVGVPVPASLDSKSADAIKWYADYGEKHPWVIAVRDYRRLNTVYKKLAVPYNEMDNDGIFHYAIKYFGASTGRFSGGGGFNMQNLPRGELFGVDLRSLIKPRPGYRFLISDYSQIEARLLLWRVGDTAFIDMVNETGNVYMAYALKTGEYTGKNLKKDNPDLYMLSKVKVLALGYGMGWRKFFVTANQWGVPVTEEQAQIAVASYRSSNPKVCELWRHHDKWLHVSAIRGDATHEVPLRSGRSLIYHSPVLSGDGVKVALVQGDKPEYHYYGGKITENEIQATARDILRDAWIGLARVYGDGFVDFTAHDEFVIEVPVDNCNDDTLAEVKRIMVTSSPWAKGCPLDAEMHFADQYCK